MGLEEEYFELLRSFGLSQPIDDRPVAKKLEDIEYLAKSAPHEGQRRRASEVLEMIDLLNQKTGGEVTKRLRETGDLTKSQQLDDYLSILKERMSSRGIENPSNVYFNKFPTREFNAAAYPCKSGYLCLLNTGLLRMLHNIAHAACYPIFTSGKDIYYDLEKKDKHTLSLTEVSLAVAVRVIINYLNLGTHEYPLPLNYKIQPWGALHATGISRAMKLFVLAHELAHVILGHCKSNIKRTIAASNYNIDVILKSHENEFEADLWAQDLLLPTCNSNEEPFPLGIGGIAFLTVHLMILTICAKITNQTFDPNKEVESHPSSIKRIERLRTFLESKIDQQKRKEIFRLWSILFKLLELIQQSNIEAKDEKITIIPGKYYHGLISIDGVSRVPDLGQIK